MKFNKEQLRDDLRKRRRSNGRKVSVATISRASKVSASTIYNVILDRHDINLSSFVKLCNYLKTPPERYFKTNE